MEILKNIDINELINTIAKLFIFFVISIFIFYIIINLIINKYSIKIKFNNNEKIVEAIPIIPSTKN